MIASKSRRSVVKADPLGAAEIITLDPFQKMVVEAFREILARQDRLAQRLDDLAALLIDVDLDIK